MTITFRSLTSTGDFAGDGGVATKPSGVVAGDFLWQLILTVPDATLTPPSGWTLAGSATRGGDMTIFGYYKIAGGSEPADYTWGGLPGWSAGILAAYIGVDNADPLDDIQTQADFGDYVIPAYTVANANSLVLINVGSLPASTPSGATARDAVASASTIEAALFDIGRNAGSFSSENGTGVGYAVLVTVLNEDAGGGGGEELDRGSDDTVDVTDGTATSAAYGRSGSDSVVITEALTTSATYARAGSDSITVSDAVDLEFAISFTSDTIDLTDTIAAQVTLGRSASDSISMGDDALVVGVSFGRTPSDSIDTTETLLTATDYVRTGSDSVSVADSPSIEVGRSPSDTISCSDALATATSYWREGSDSIVISDETDATIGAVVTVEPSDSISIAESLQTSTSYVRGSDDSIGVTDACAPACAYARAGSDAVAVLDEVERELFVPESGTIDVAVSDSLGITDTLQQVADYIRTGSDALALSDQAARALEALRSASDTVSTSDALATGSAYGRLLSDAVGATDQLVTWADYRRLLSDAVAVADEVECAIVTPNIEVAIEDQPLGVADDLLVSRWIPIGTPLERTALVKGEDRTVRA